MLQLENRINIIMATLHRVSSAPADLSAMGRESPVLAPVSVPVASPVPSGSPLSVSGGPSTVHVAPPSGTLTASLAHRSLGLTGELRKVPPISFRVVLPCFHPDGTRDLPISYEMTPEGREVDAVKDRYYQLKVQYEAEHPGLTLQSIDILNSKAYMVDQAGHVTKVPLYLSEDDELRKLFNACYKRRFPDSPSIQWKVFSPQAIDNIRGRTIAFPTTERAEAVSEWDVQRMYEDPVLKARIDRMPAAERKDRFYKIWVAKHFRRAMKAKIDETRRELTRQRAILAAASPDHPQIADIDAQIASLQQWEERINDSEKRPFALEYSLLTCDMRGAPSTAAARTAELQHVMGSMRPPSASWYQYRVGKVPALEDAGSVYARDVVALASQNPEDWLDRSASFDRLLFQLVQDPNPHHAAEEFCSHPNFPVPPELGQAFVEGFLTEAAQFRADYQGELDQLDGCPDITAARAGFRTIIADAHDPVAYPALFPQ
jgi:hypothetical protein